MAGGFDKGREKAKALATDTGKITVYKMGGDGAVTFSRNDTVATGVYKVDALKPIGAGDSFMAGFVTGLAEGLSLHDAVLRGSACAAIVVTKVGCAPAMPTPAELADFIASHPGPTIPQE